MEVDVLWFFFLVGGHAPVYDAFHAYAFVSYVKTHGEKGESGVLCSAFGTSCDDYHDG